MKNDFVLIKAFNSALATDSDNLSFREVNDYAMRLGYFVHPDVCNMEVLRFLNEMSINYNSTFYKTWEDVTSKSRFELFIDQILHYTTTYGTEFECGNGYVPNDGEQDIPEFNKYKVILPISEEELYEKCLNLVCSGIALKAETINHTCKYIIDYVNNNSVEFNIEDVKNKEAQALLCSELNIFPTTSFGLIRLVMYATTRDTMIINNQEMILKIKTSLKPFDFNKLDEKSLVLLSKIFLRYKDLFLAFKHNKNVDNKRVINKLRKLANKYHQPLKASFWDTIFTEEKSADEIKEEAEKLNPYRKIRIMQSCLERNAALDYQVYITRNQKMFLREDYKPNVNCEYNDMVYSILKDSLVNSMKIDDEKTIRIDSRMDVALPTSEKSFIGNYPWGTKYKMTEDNIIGIYWRNAWGTNDFDLSMINTSGRKIGWNLSYYTEEQDVVYSGDMTNADPEATELLYIKSTCQDGVIRVNQFRGAEESKYKFFFAQEKIDLQKDERGRANIYNYMCDPNSVKFETEVTVNGQKEQQIALVKNGEVILMAIGCGYNRVSASGIKSAMRINMVNESLYHKAQCFVQARDILAEAGYNIVDETYVGDVDYDFSCLEKDTLISMINKQ